MSRSLRRQPLVNLIESYLRNGASIEMDGLGRFKLSSSNHLRFKPHGRIPVFLAYAHEDRPRAKRLSAALRKAGFEPWLDEEKLLPGQNWPRAIERAIDECEFFIACYSRESVSKRGPFQREIAYALDVALHVPLEEIYFIPVRLDDCALPVDIARKIQHVDLFAGWNRGAQKLICAMRRQAAPTPQKLKKC